MKRGHDTTQDFTSIFIREKAITRNTILLYPYSSSFSHFSQYATSDGRMLTRRRKRRTILNRRDKTNAAMDMSKAEESAVVPTGDPDHSRTMSSKNDCIGDALDFIADEWNNSMNSLTRDGSPVLGGTAEEDCIESVETADPTVGRRPLCRIGQIHIVEQDDSDVVVESRRGTTTTPSPSTGHQLPPTQVSAGRIESLSPPHSLPGSSLSVIQEAKELQELNDWLEAAVEHQESATSASEQECDNDDDGDDDEDDEQEPQLSRSAQPKKE